ncbi:MAG: dependent oxidoreductase, partial [Flavipsychrobacter sp.]|nr:dependent oxidoreductase [Flavipsychrobacter sp.]
MEHRDGTHKSLWQDVYEHIPSQMAEDTIYDVLIIGGGITGVTAALLLTEAGKKCVLAEANTIGFGTTGGTSAHINTFADTTYKQAANAFSEADAQLFANAITEGFEVIRQQITTLGISCDFEEKTGFLYAQTDDEVKQLDDIYDGAKMVGVPVATAEEVPTPIAYKKALAFTGQAQFHPLKYLAALAKAFISKGGIILEHTHIERLETDEKIHTAIATDKSIKAKQVIYATHMPPGVNLFSFRCAPYRSYVLAVTLTDDNYPDALVYDMQEPYHYFRTHEIKGKKYLVAGGNDHKTGHDDPEQAFAELESYLRKHYNVGEVAYKWSSQYYVPVDGLPYIGHMTGMPEGIYCDTGYNGNVMMLGSIAAKILTNLNSVGSSK